MKQSYLVYVLGCLALAKTALSDDHMGMKDAQMEQEMDVDESQQVDWDTVEAAPWPEAHHGMPILDMKLTPAQQKFWNEYNTTTYFTIDTPYQGYLSWHVSLALLSAFVFYPVVMILNNLESSWFLPCLAVQAATTIVSCISFSIFINNVPDLYPNMAYKKMVTGLFVFTILQFTFALFNTISKWSKTHHSSKFFNSLPSEDEDGFALEEMHSPAATLYDVDSDSERLGSKKTALLDKRDSIMAKLAENPVLSKLSFTFSTLFTILHNCATWGLFFYFMILLPTGVACLNLLGQGNHVFNLLAHFIKGGVFMALGLLSLARYCGCYSQMGGAWNYAFIGDRERKYGKMGIFLRLHKPGQLITSFEMLESCLILFYGCTNVFLEHLASEDGAWTAKDLQHVSIAFMYLGTGLCGVIAELKLASWRKSLFFKTMKDELDEGINLQTISCTPGFSPNPFPVFTIFWTGLLMSKHAQSSALSTDVHVQWGSLLTYGSFFRVFTFIWMTFAPSKNSSSLLPGKPFTELVTSFCLLCGGLVFMESTDQSINALAYRGFTPMFTINVSVGVISLLMAWIMLVIAFKDYLKGKLA